MSWTINKTMRRVLFVLGGSVVLFLAAPFMIGFVEWCGGNHYPGTVRQTGAIALLGNGKRVAIAVCSYHIEHDEWPRTLAEVIKEGLLTREQVCSYPKSDDLPDRRDILKMKDFEEWIYIKPQESAPDLPMVAAPRPYTSSMGRTLPKPRRIVIDRETVAVSIEEEKLAPILQKLAGNGSAR